MASPLETAIRQVRGFLADCEPEAYSSDDAARVVTWAVELERQAQAVKLLFFEAASQSLAWVEAGCSSPEQWLAQLSKAPLGEAISTAEASKALQELPGTKDAVRDGKLSSDQVREITRAASTDPSTEAELLELAGTESLKGLKDRARQLRAASASRRDEAERYQDIERRRFIRFWTDPEGAACFQGRCVPDKGARLRAALEAEADCIFQATRAEGRRESPEAYLLDALLSLVGVGSATERTQKGGRPRGHDQVLVLVDADALQRGHVRRGERCEIAGAGPVPVAVARRIADGGADLWAIFEKATDIQRVHHVGRAIPKAMQVSLLVRDGRRCQVPDCSVTHNLEAHHWREPYAVAGTTSLDNLVLVCSRHHDLITYGGWSMEGGPGRWRFRGPPEEPPEGIFATG